MQIKSNLTIYLTRRTREGFAERTVACESVIISVVQLLQTWGFIHCNFAHKHFIAICKERYSGRCVTLCFGACVLFGAWFRHLDAYPDPEQLDWKSFKNWCLKTYFRSSLPDPENILQSGSKRRFRAKFAITLLFSFGWEEVRFASVFWKLSWWVVLPSPYILTCCEHAVWRRGGTWSSGLS